jgi:two-component sensor histidine kinase
LDLDRAVGLGVAVNELVANAAEHAFDDGKLGTINIRLTPADSRTGEPATLIVADDGRGLGKARDGSSGLDLVRALVRRARGRVELAEGEGTIWRIALD